MKRIASTLSVLIVMLSLVGCGQRTEARLLVQDDTKTLEVFTQRGFTYRRTHITWQEGAEIIHANPNKQIKLVPSSDITVHSTIVPFEASLGGYLLIMVDENRYQSHLYWNYIRNGHSEYRQVTTDTPLKAGTVTSKDDLFIIDGEIE